LEQLYRSAAEILIRFLEIKVPSNLREDRPVWTQRAFDQERFEWELNFFCKKFLEPVARIKLSPAQNIKMQSEISEISGYLARLPQHFVHRDFHSRNVMVHDERLAVIDFQDARLGPAAYDAVSLFYDSYVPFAAEDRRKMFTAFLQLAGVKLGHATRLEIEQQWRAVLLQRQLKAIGSFGYLTIDKNKGNYLKYVKPALSTLKGAGINDPRWPFLSVELLELIDSAMGG
jgi:aminoglycoside/choline kinase family phosphotransferase